MLVRFGKVLALFALLTLVMTWPQAPRLATDAYERSIGSRILAASTRVIAVSEAVAAHVIDLGAIPEKVVVVPNGVDTELFRPPEGPRSTQITFVGRLISNKRPEDALEAFARLGRDEWQLVFVGDGPMRRGLEARASELGITGRVRFLGTRTDIPQLLAESAIVVRPSLTEGRSLAILEAMATGLPVVATAVGANPDLVTHGKTGVIVPVGDDEAIAQALVGLARHPDRARAMGRAARFDVECRFGMRAMVSAYQQLYDLHLSYANGHVKTSPQR